MNTQSSAQARLLSRMRVAVTGASVALLAGSALAAGEATTPNTEPVADTHWLSYNGTADGQRYARDAQITAANANQLGEHCRLKVAESGSFHSGLVQLDGTLYLTTAQDTLAVDATNCIVRWRNHYVPEQPEVFPVNRGVAYANGKLFRGTADGRLLAIDAATGKTLWQQQIGDPLQGEFFSAAPIVWQGLLILGSAGSDWGVRGRIMAYQQDTGQEVWRFNVIPTGDEPGAETWKNFGSARYGGGGSWTHYSIDHQTGEVFVPIGNPAPDLIPAHRPGSNLYTDSMVVLDARTGKLRWYHQIVSNDGHDLDLGAAPMLYHDEKGRSLVVLGSKNGHVYGIDRETRKRVYDTVITRIKNEGVQPKPGVPLNVCPGVLGGVEWNGAAYDHKNKAVVIGAVDWCSTITAKQQESWIPGEFMFGGSWTMDDESYGWVRALDGQTGAIRWSYKAAGPVVAGITPSAGGVVFTGDMAGNFLVLDSHSGQPLYKDETGGAVAGGVITYSRGGKQYVATTSGNVSRATFGASGAPTLILYTLGGNAKATGASRSASVQTEATTGGERLYSTNCSACHGRDGEGGVGPALKGLKARLDLEQTIAWIKNPSSKMPKLHPSPLDDNAVAAIAAYVQRF